MANTQEECNIVLILCKFYEHFTKILFFNLYYVMLLPNRSKLCEDAKIIIQNIYISIIDSIYDRYINVLPPCRENGQ